MNMKFDWALRCARAFGVLVALAFTLTGCFDMRGAVSVKPDGDHVGRYVIGMSSAMYASMMMQQPDFFDDFNDFSSPSVWADDGVTYIADDSGEANMLGFYDKANCDGEEGLLCTYEMEGDDLDFPGWSVDWEVSVADGVEIVGGNYQSISEAAGAHTMKWHFDGNKVSQFVINYTIRLPSGSPGASWLFKLIPFIGGK